MFIFFVVLIGVYFNRHKSIPKPVYKHKFKTNIVQPTGYNIYEYVKLEKDRIDEQKRSNERFKQSFKPFKTGIVKEFYNTIDHVDDKNLEYRIKNNYINVLKKHG